ncbi:MAG: rifampicin phosphotransferase [Gaiellales bacterium]|nr:rifampicin phosphotransferase [Gaiellales bacterium]
MTEQPPHSSPRTWLPDASHYPEQMTPLSATTWFEAVGAGLHEAMRELRGPFGGFRTRTDGGWAYEGELQPEWDVDPDGLKTAALALGDRWEDELRPRAHAITAEIDRMRPERPPPGDAQQLLDRLWELVQEHWTIHFLVVIPAQIAAEILYDRYVELLGEDESDPLAPYRLLEGLPNESVAADTDLWRLAKHATHLDVAADLLEFPDASVRSRLALTMPGRLWLHELDRHLIRYGGRAHWHELSLPRESESPQLTMASIRLFLQRGEPPHSRAAERDRLEADVLARAPSIADVLEPVKRAHPLKESHTYHIDYPGLQATRNALRAFGRRLAAEGILADPDGVWMLHRQELRDALTGSGDSVAALVEQRGADLRGGRADGARPYLGEPPEDQDRHAALEKFYGTAGAAGSGPLRGAAASPGVAEGPACVVSGADDFARVQAGDVLVATTTTPAWTPLFPSLAALVTDTGGILSHAAVIAREYGIPAVVGAGGATAAISDGQRLRVDGGRGEVTVIPSS